jgi:hypothetical protein
MQEWCSLKIIRLSIVFVVLCSPWLLNHAHAENKDLPITITQVELDDSYLIIPDDVSCAQWNEMAIQKKVPYYCIENIVPNKAVECAMFITHPNVCTPVHMTYNFTNACSFHSELQSGGTPIVEKYSKGNQWIILHNTQNNNVSISGFNMKWNSTGFYENYDANFSLTLSPREDCTIAGYFVNSNTSTALIQYKYHGNSYVFKTPRLTDNHHDSGIWQYDGTTWTFEQLPVPNKIAPPPPTSVGCYYWAKETGWQLLHA